MSQCRGCGAEILWAATQTGKRIPLDTKSEKRFVVRSLARGTDPTVVVLADTYVSHFATCPKAKDFRHAE